MSIRVEKPEGCQASILETSRTRGMQGIVQPTETFYGPKTPVHRGQDTAGVHISCQGCPLHERGFSRSGPEATFSTREKAVGRDATTWLGTMCEDPGRKTLFDNVLQRAHEELQAFQAKQD